MAIAGVDLIFPNPFPNSIRTSFLVDAGNVFQTADLIKNSTESGVTGTVTQDAIQLKKSASNGRGDDTVAYFYAVKF